MVQISTPGVTPNRGMGPPWGAFCQITLTSCLKDTLTYSILAYVNNTLQLQHSSLIKTAADKVNSFQNCLSQ